MEFLRILLNIFDFVHFRLNLIFTSIFFEQFRIWVLTVPYLGFNNSNRFLKEFVCYVMKGNIRNIENIPSRKKLELIKKDSFQTSQRSCIPCFSLFRSAYTTFHRNSKRKIVEWLSSGKVLAVFLHDMSEKMSLKTQFPNNPLIQLHIDITHGKKSHPLQGQ